MTQRCNACGEKLTNTNDHHTYYEPDPKTGDPPPIMTCNIHNIVCGFTTEES